MNLYEFVFIIRQDVSSADVDKVTADIVSMVNDYEGKVVKKEYWGLRNLAYKIKGNNKGHYMFLGIEVPVSFLPEMERKLKLSSDIIRHSIMKVKEITPEPSEMIKSLNADDTSVNITG